MFTNLPRHLANLNDEQRLAFYELLAHNFTISIRGVCADTDASYENRLGRIKWINEMLHRITIKVHKLRTGTNDVTEEDSVADLRHWVSQEPSVAVDVDWAIRSSVDCASQTTMTRLD